MVYFVAEVFADFYQALIVKFTRQLLANDKRCRDTAKHLGGSVEVSGDHVSWQVLIHLLRVVESVFPHQALPVTLKHSGHLSRELLDPQSSIFGRFFLAFFLLLDGFRRRCCGSSAMAYLFNSAGR